MDPSLSTLPLQIVPHDSLRNGLPTLKEDTAAAHPVEAILKKAEADSKARKMEQTRSIYGSAAAARITIEEQILGRVQRLPGLPSSRLGLEVLSGRMDHFGFESYLGLPQDSELAPPDLHTTMEAKLKMGKTQTQTRGFI